MAVLRWMCHRKRFCRCCCLCLIAVITVLYVIGYSRYRESLCSDEKSRKLIEDLCELYKKKVVAGRVCESLCDKNVFHYEKCSNYNKGKKVIFFMCDTCERDGPVRAVLKTKSELSERERLKLFYDTDGNLTPESFQFVVKIMQNFVKQNFGYDLSNSDNILTFLWGYDFNRYVKLNGRNATVIAIQSIWSVLQQVEYTFMKIHEGHIFVPKLYGTCGPVYVTEYTPPGDELESEVSFSWSTEWKYRAKLAIHLLDLIQTLDTNLHQTLHLCDVKGSNFGVNRHNQMTLIDTDSVFFHDSFKEQMKFSNCTQDQDCDFFDCRGLCDSEKKICFETRVNNNLQVICEDVFLGPVFDYHTGLLRYPPSNVREDLWSVIEECAFPDKQKPSRAATPSDVGFKLKNILSKSISGDID